MGNVVSGLASVVEDELSKKAQTQIEGELGVLRGEVQTEVRRIFSTHLEWINVRRVAGLFVRMQSAPLGAALNRRDADRRFFRKMIAVASLVSILAIARVTYRTHAPLPVAATAAGAGVVLWLLVRNLRLAERETYARHVRLLPDTQGSRHVRGQLEGVADPRGRIRDAAVANNSRASANVRRRSASS